MKTRTVQAVEKPSYFEWMQHIKKERKRLTNNLEIWNYGSK